MKSNIIIREYSPGDYQDIVNAGYPFSLPDLRSQYGWKGWILRIIYFLARLDRKVFVAYSTDDRKTVGIVTLTKINDRIWGVWNIFVSPLHRRRGISTQLYQKCFEYLRNKRVKKAVGSVATDNTTSIRGIEKTWDRFLSQRFCHYSGTVPYAPHAKTDRIIIRNLHPVDRETLFQIYNRCTSEDWKTSLEVTEKDFLGRFIGKIYGKGLSKLMIKRRIVVAEDDEKIVGYAIITQRRFLQQTSDAATLFSFLPPQISHEVGAHIINRMLSDLADEGVKTISVYSHAQDKDTMRQILMDASLTPTIFMVPIVEFYNVSNVNDEQCKCLRVIE